MRWGLYSGTQEAAYLLIAECEAGTYGEAIKKLAKHRTGDNPREVRQLACEGECVVGRHYPSSGPILQEGELDD